jgi:hypothetical protein
VPGVPGSGQQSRAIVSAGAYVPRGRLRNITEFLGSGGAAVALVVGEDGPG